MKKPLLAVIGLLGLALATPVWADAVVHLPFQEAVQRATAEGVLDGSVQFYLAGTAAPGHVIKAGVVTNKKTNAFAKDDDKVYEHVLRSALIQLQLAAKNNGASSVRNIVSYFKKDTYSSA